MVIPFEPQPIVKQHAQPAIADLTSDINEAPLKRGDAKATVNGALGGMRRQPDLDAAACVRAVRNEPRNRSFAAGLGEAEDVSQDRARALGVTSQTVRRSLQAMLSGFQIGEYRDSDAYAILRADAVVVLSASSKTAIGFAQRASERGVASVVGLTSPPNAEFVRSVGWYDQVVTYDDIDRDHVTVKLSKPLLTAGNVNDVFKFNTGMVGDGVPARQELRLIDLTPVAASGLAQVAVGRQ